LNNNSYNPSDISITQPITAVHLETATVGHESPPQLEIGILTIGKPTLVMAISSLLLQNEQNIRIHLVDTAPSPIINRPEVQSVLRLAAEQEITCSYEHLHDDKRAFSVGKLALLETLKGEHVCFMDDDVVVPCHALTAMFRYIEANPQYGWLAPFCKNMATARTALGGRPHYAPGGVFRQDRLVRNILLEYYDTTVDVLDKQRSSRKVWEIAFLTELFPMLDRSTFVQRDNVIYHLDYHERPNWDLLQESLVHNSHDVARRLVEKYRTVMRT